MGEIVFADFTKTPYRLTVKAGDVVKMPNGITGTVRSVNTVSVNGKEIKVVFVEPKVILCRRWWMHFAGRLWFYGEEINKLMKVRS